jgi:hypothetical protein
MAAATKPLRSGAGLLAVPSQSLDLISELAGTALVTPRESHRQGEFQLLKLMFTFDLRAALQMAPRCRGCHPQRGRGSAAATNHPAGRLALLAMLAFVRNWMRWVAGAIALEFNLTVDQAIIRAIGGAVRESHG